jgi:D-amino-acid dehydrogenase
VITPASPPSTSSDGVVIVGGGVIGIACAHYLRAAGREVTVIDQGAVGAACSQSNCGYICPSHVPPLTEPGAFAVAIKSMLNPRSPFRVKPRLSPALMVWLWQFARRCTHNQVLRAGKHLQAILDASMAEYHALIANEHFDCEWATQGLLYVFRSEKAYEQFSKSDRMLTDHFGVTADQIPGKQLASLDPGLRDDLFGAFHYPRDTSLNPQRLMQQWSAALRRQGVRFLEHVALRTVHKKGGRISAIETTNNERLEASEFVFAMGAWSTKWSQTLECSIPIEPGKGYSVTIDRPNDSPTYPMLFPEEKVGVSPFATGLRLGSMMEFVGFDSTIPPHRIQQLRDASRPYLRASVDGPAQSTWYGWRPMTWDSLPIIGRVPALANAYLATGHNMLGMSLATSTGRLLSELIHGQSPHIDPKPYAPDRF